MLQTRIKNRLIRRGIVALALLATLPGIPVAAGQTFDEAVAAYGRGDYATAVRVFLVHAAQGDATVPSSTSGSCTPTGGAFSRTRPKLCAGTGWPPSRVIAGAQFNLGVMYANGRGVLKDEAEAVRWYRLAAEQGRRRCPVQPRGHVRQRAGRSQGRGRSCALVPAGRRAG